MAHSIEEQDRIGLEIAKTLQLKRSKEHKDRWELTTGTKTNIGVYNTILRFGRMTEQELSEYRAY